MLGLLAAAGDLGWGWIIYAWVDADGPPGGFDLVDNGTADAEPAPSGMPAVAGLVQNGQPLHR